mgnify:CR=1 FL=1
MPSRESIFDKYNMSAAERRLVMSVVVALMVALAWMAFTSIDDPGKTSAKIFTAEKNIDKFQEEIDKDEIDYMEIDFEGVEYLEDENSGQIYSVNHQLLGKWNENFDDILWVNESFKVQHDTTKD